MGYCTLVQYVNYFCMLIRGETKKSWGLFGDLRYKNLTNKTVRNGEKAWAYPTSCEAVAQILHLGGRLWVESESSPVSGLRQRIR